MKYLKNAYVFRYDEKTHTWKKIILERVLVSGTAQNFRLSDTLDRDAYLVLRIMQNPQADIQPQDVVAFEDDLNDIPPEENRYIVVSVTRNTQGSKRVQHAKVMCR